MKYSLRSLPSIAIAVSLAVLVVFIRVDNLRRWAEYHESEAWKWSEIQDLYRIYQERHMIAGNAGRKHAELAEQYRRAMYRPWIIVDEPPADSWPTFWREWLPENQTPDSILPKD